VSEHVRIRVASSEPYDVAIGAGDDFLAAGLAAAGAGAAQRGVVITDRRVAAAGHAARVAAAWRGLGVDTLVVEVEAGEGSKGLATYGGLLADLAEAGCGRDAWIGAVGGGVVGDLAGFVAATYLRGVAFVQIPTTLLAMVDASTGGKTGLNLPAGKNLVGAFHQPRGVVIDVGALSTLPDVDLREGAVELYKHALLIDAPWRGALGAHGAVRLPAVHEVGAWIALIAAGVAVKADVVAADPFERGVRAHLNLGHTLAHALEAATDHGLRHGAAVAFGLVFAACLGAARSYHDWRAEAVALARYAGATTPPAVAFDTLATFMGRDKKRKAGRLRFVLLEAPGRPVIRDDVTMEELRSAFDALHELLPGGTR
jgi:3-dehydroquinate synthase